MICSFVQATVSAFRIPDTMQSKEPVRGSLPWMLYWHDLYIWRIKTGRSGMTYRIRVSRWRRRMESIWEDRAWSTCTKWAGQFCWIDYTMRGIISVEIEESRYCLCVDAII